MCLPKWAVHSKGSSLFDPVSAMLPGAGMGAGIDFKWARGTLWGDEAIPSLNCGDSCTTL